MLLRQGRISELLELHAGFGLPEDCYVREQAQSLHEIECFEAAGGPMPRAAVEHTLALARLRQGRFEEVEPLCASGLAGDWGPDACATILATIALARRALGKSHADLLSAAVALSPDADLVAEAALDTAEVAAAGIRGPGQATEL
jgi:hypothetical protein